MSRLLTALLLTFTHANSLWAQYCNDTRFTGAPIFTASDIVWETNVTYGFADNWYDNEPHPDFNYFDIAYPDPAIDAMEKRPLIFLAHGGGFWGGEKENLTYYQQMLAQAGYVVVSTNYRKGWMGSPVDCAGDPASLVIAIYRAMQDVQASMRFVVSQREKYGIDTAQIFAGGESAGVYAILTSMFTSQEEWDTDFPFLSAYYGGIDNETNNVAIDFSVKGYISMWGGMYNAEAISASEAKPTIAFYGAGDDIIPPYYGTIQSCTDYPNVYGGAGITEYLSSLGVCTELHVNPTEGHVAYEPEYTAAAIACFVKRVMCDDCTSGNYTFKEADCAEDYAPETVGVTTENEVAIQAFPNPVHTLMQIRLPAHWKATPDIIITNASGEQVQVPVTYNTQLVVCDMQQLPSGLYHIQMRAENEFARATCIVAH